MPAHRSTTYGLYTALQIAFLQYSYLVARFYLEAPCRHFVLAKRQFVEPWDMHIFKGLRLFVL